MMNKIIANTCKVNKLIHNQSMLKIQKRMMMLLHEYQAQGLLKKYNVAIPKVISA